MEKKLDNALKILSRIRCLKECALSLKDGKEFPHAMYYTPIETEYRTMSTVHVATYRQPRAEIGNNLIHCTPTHRLHLSGNYEYNSDGLWGKLIKASFIFRGLFRCYLHPIIIILQLHKSSSFIFKTFISSTLS